MGCLAKFRFQISKKTLSYAHSWQQFILMFLIIYVKFRLQLNILYSELLNLATYDSGSSRNKLSKESSFIPPWDADSSLYKMGVSRHHSVIPPFPQFFIFHSSLLSLNTKCMNVKIQGKVLYWECCHTAIKKAGPRVCVCGWIQRCVRLLC